MREVEQDVLGPNAKPVAYPERNEDSGLDHAPDS
jgi:hypothetical protein